jgi:hypothetical protein
LCFQDPFLGNSKKHIFIFFPTRLHSTLVNFLESLQTPLFTMENFTVSRQRLFHHHCLRGRISWGPNNDVCITSKKFTSVGRPHRG